MLGLFEENRTTNSENVVRLLFLGAHALCLPLRRGEVGQFLETACKGLVVGES